MNRLSIIHSLSAELTIAELSPHTHAPLILTPVASPRGAPGGALLIVDFGDFARYPALPQRAQHAWLARFSVTPIPDLEGQFKALAGQIGFAATMIGLYGGYAVQAWLTAS